MRGTVTVRTPSCGASAPAVSCGLNLSLFDSVLSVLRVQSSLPCDGVPSCAEYCPSAADREDERVYLILDNVCLSWQLPRHDARARSDGTHSKRHGRLVPVGDRCVTRLGPRWCHPVPFHNTRLDSAVVLSCTTTESVLRYRRMLLLTVTRTVGTAPSRSHHTLRARLDHHHPGTPQGHPATQAVRTRACLHSVLHHAHRTPRP